MSWKASGYVKELRDGLTVTDKFVLLVLAEYHRTDEKLSWPSVATLADDCLMTERGVRQILARLVKNGFIMRSQTGNGRGNISGYKIVGLDIKKGELETVNGCAPFKETLHSHAVKGERNPAQPAYRNKEEPVLEPVEPGYTSPSVPECPPLFASSDKNNGVQELDSTLHIDKLFNYFRHVTGKSDRYTLTKKRSQMAASRWKEALRITKGNSEEAKKIFRDVIDAIAASDFHQKNGFVEWEQLFRSEDNFTKWAERAENPSDAA